ncbi:PREDICTED: condensin complex subunit 2-like [Habropoda laboriosa]|uniref:condensin complex subunit 2-like n=1 Tax=Habropoda laboriosa TaxID=597456 RepID=UPI00083D92F9|nr:PREDICTED: condensin complex subunit 2-like [Habropoda laboriosa]
MATSMSMANIQSTPATSSSLRRKSVFTEKTVLTSALSENDDEAERLARRREINVESKSTTPLSGLSLNDRRRSLGISFLMQMPPSQMTERISQCIKLGTENKINPKNAFSLEMIDFMIYMIKKKDANMCNLQVASTSLDVSTKIYGFRVDGIHMEVLKMMGGIDKQDNGGGNKNNFEDINSQKDTEDNQNKEKREKKKKKKCKQVFTTVEALKINVETEKPSLITMEADSLTTNMLYQVMLPNHANSKFYPHSYNDILVDTVNGKDSQDNDTTCRIPNIEDFSHMEICPPLFYFDFQSWNADDELNEVQSEKNNENRFEFDLNASLPHEDEHVFSSINYFDIEGTEEEDVDKCAEYFQVENIVDFRKVLTKTSPPKVSEYSFIQKNFNIHWAGPSHWKVSNFRKALSNSKVIETCRQAPMRKRKEIELCYNDETIKSVNSKFLPSQMVKLHNKTVKNEWKEEGLVLPPDEHYDIIQANKLYHHTTTFKHLENTDNMNATSLSNEMEDYNYENEIPNCVPNKHGENETNDVIDNGIISENGHMLGTQIAFTGNNLVTIPKFTNKLTIAYSVHAKKIDMKQLKHSIWKCLKGTKHKTVQETATAEAMQQDENLKMNDSKHFSDIYKELPNVLTKTNMEALSFPIAFVSLLHLANEKTLRISSSSDMADLIIEQN